MGRNVIGVPAFYETAPIATSAGEIRVWASDHGMSPLRAFVQRALLTHN